MSVLMSASERCSIYLLTSSLPLQYFIPNFLTSSRFKSILTCNFITEQFRNSLQIHDALERDNDDIDSSGSGYGEGDDEDDIHAGKDKDRVIKEQTTNIHQSGDGSESRVNLDNTDEDDDYIENHKEREPLPIDGEDDSLYFDNSNNNSNNLSTSTDNKIASTTTDDEDSQFTFLLFISF